MIYVDIGMRGQAKGVSVRAAAKEVGVSAITLRRWLLMGKVAEVSRDRNRWRIFTPSDIERIKEYADRRQSPESEE